MTIDPIAIVSLVVLLVVNLLALGAMWGSLNTKVDGVLKAVSREGDDGLVGRRELETALEDNRRVHVEIKNDHRSLAGTVGYHTERIGAVEATVSAMKRD